MAQYFGVWWSTKIFMLHRGTDHCRPVGKSQKILNQMKKKEDKEMLVLQCVCVSSVLKWTTKHLGTHSRARKTKRQRKMRQACWSENVCCLLLPTGGKARAVVTRGTPRSSSTHANVRVWCKANRRTCTTFNCRLARSGGFSSSRRSLRSQCHTSGRCKQHQRPSRRR